jgi:hypothetical protein
MQPLVNPPIASTLICKILIVEDEYIIANDLELMALLTPLPRLWLL